MPFFTKLGEAVECEGNGKSERARIPLPFIFCIKERRESEDFPLAQRSSQGGASGPEHPTALASFIGGFVFLFLILFAPLIYAEEAQEMHVRVAIAQEVPVVHVTVLAPCQWEDAQSATVIAKNPFVLWQSVEPAANGVKIGSLVSKGPIRLKPMEGALVRIGGRPYRGNLIFYRTTAGKLTVVNQLDLEEYLVGAVGSEVGRHWPPEALKAQAVVSRTMIAHRILIRRRELFDVTADASTHLYDGVVAERPEIRRAVAATRGQVLVYRGEPLPAAFHANCGGHTEDASELWDVTKDPVPLTGRVDPYCRDQKHFRWQRRMSLPDFTKTLGPLAQEIGDLVSFETGERNRSGRVRIVRLEGSGATATVTGRKFRELLGPNWLRSLNFTAQINGNHIDFEGFGWGHGVGLCQWGAYAMAHEGHSVEEILRFYFPDTELRALRISPPSCALRSTELVQRDAGLEELRTSLQEPSSGLEEEFKVWDRVFFPREGEGTVMGFGDGLNGGKHEPTIEILFDGARGPQLKRYFLKEIQNLLVHLDGNRRVAPRHSSAGRRTKWTPERIRDLMGRVKKELTAEEVQAIRVREKYGEEPKGSLKRELHRFYRAVEDRESFFPEYPHWTTVLEKFGIPVITLKRTASRNLVLRDRELSSLPRVPLQMVVPGYPQRKFDGFNLLTQLMQTWNFAQREGYGLSVEGADEHKISSPSQLKNVVWTVIRDKKKEEGVDLPAEFPQMRTSFPSGKPPLVNNFVLGDYELQLRIVLYREEGKLSLRILPINSTGLEEISVADFLYDIFA